jgi:hypothetical protein
VEELIRQLRRSFEEWYFSSLDPPEGFSKANRGTTNPASMAALVNTQTVRAIDAELLRRNYYRNQTCQMLKQPENASRAPTGEPEPVRLPRRRLNALPIVLLLCLTLIVV